KPVCVHDVGAARGSAGRPPVRGEEERDERRPPRPGAEGLDDAPAVGEAEVRERRGRADVDRDPGCPDALHRRRPQPARDGPRPGRIRGREDAAPHVRILPAVTESLAHDLDAMAGATAYNDWLIDRARPWLHGRVLDVGAGIGTHTRQLLELADEVVALEPEPGLAELLQQYVDGAEIVVGDASAVEGPFDAIVCFNVLEHIADDEGTLRRFRELLAPDGALLLLVPAHPFLYGKIDHAFGHERRYVKKELRQKLRRAGLEPEVLRHANPVGALGWLT